jgi:hypothetical protein
MFGTNGTTSKTSNGTAGARSSGGGRVSAGTRAAAPAPRQSVSRQSTASFVSESAGAAPVQGGGGGGGGGAGGGGGGSQIKPGRVRSDVDGSRWKGRRSDDEILASMSDKEDNGGGGIAFGAGLGLDMDEEGEEGDDLPELVDDDEGDELGLDGDGDDAGEGEELEQDTDAGDGEDQGDDELESALEIDEAKIAAQYLLKNGGDRDEILGLLKHAPKSLVQLAKRLYASQNGQAEQGAAGQSGQPAGAKGQDPFDAALEQALAPTMKALSQAFDVEGQDETARALVEPVRAGLRFFGEQVTQKFAEVEQLVNRLGAMVEAEQVSAARAALAEQYPGISNDKLYARVEARMKKMTGGGHKSVRELMADAAQRELGTLTAAQRRVQETKSRRQRALGTSAEGVGHSSGGKQQITREKAAEVIHALIERGMSGAERQKYMSSKYVVVDPRKKNAGA